MNTYCCPICRGYLTIYNSISYEIRVCLNIPYTNHYEMQFSNKNYFVIVRANGLYIYSSSFYNINKIFNWSEKMIDYFLLAETPLQEVNFEYCQKWLKRLNKFKLIL